MSDISIIIDDKYKNVIPGWVNITALNTVAERDWVEKNEDIYTDEYYGNPNNLSYKSSDKSTATYVSTIAYDNTNEYYYAGSVTFSLNGADKTRFTVTQKESKTGSSGSMAYSAGLGTKDKTDDVTFTNSYTSSYTSISTTSSSKVFYTDGLGNNLNISNSISGKMNTAGTSGTYSETYTLSGTDASRNKISGGFVITGTVDDSYNYTPTSLTISAGSAVIYDDFGSITTSWAKVASTDASIDIDSLFGSESTDFPVTSLIVTFSQYVMESANTITVSYPSMATIPVSSPAAMSKIIDAGAGNDTVTGGIGDDSIVGGSGNDKITGSSGDDIIQGDVSYSDETYTDVKGKDSLIGGDGNDQLDGGYGDDSLSGGNGNDLLYGAGGTDIMSGDAGNDILVAFGAKDQMTGGAGSDTFVFYNWVGTTMNATVTDFKSGTDFLDVKYRTQTTGEVELNSTNFSSGKGLTSSKNSSVFVYDTSKGNLYFDADGSSSGKGVLIVTLTGNPTLSANDFKVVDLSGYDLFS